VAYKRGLSGLSHEDMPGGPAGFTFVAVDVRWGGPLDPAVRKVAGGRYASGLAPGMVP